jgi:hypothetical protein
MSSGGPSSTGDPGEASTPTPEGVVPPDLEPSDSDDRVPGQVLMRVLASEAAGVGGPPDFVASLPVYGQLGEGAAEAAPTQTGIHDLDQALEGSRPAASTASMAATLVPPLPPPPMRSRSQRAIFPSSSRSCWSNSIRPRP